MQALLIELLYGKVTLQAKKLRIYLIIADKAIKKYLMYYLDIIPAICFPIRYQPFILFIIYAPVKCYSTNNPVDHNINSNIDKHVYREIYIADWQQTTQQAFIEFGVKYVNIILVLLTTSKIVLTNYADYIAQQPINLIIGNLSYEIWKSQVRS